MKKTLVESAERYLGEDEDPNNNVKLFVTHLSKEVSEDSYGEGEIGKRQLQMDEKIGKMFGSFDEFKKYAEKIWWGGYFNDAEAWSVIDNRIIYQQLENENGDSVVDSDPEYKKFVAGEINLWSATYDFLVELIVPSRTDEEFVRKFTGIKN